MPRDYARGKDVDEALMRSGVVERDANARVLSLRFEPMGLACVTVERFLTRDQLRAFGRELAALEEESKRGGSDL